MRSSISYRKFIFPLFAGVMMIWLVTGELIHTIEDQRLYQSLLDSGRNATARVDASRVVRKQDTQHVYNIFDYSYPDEAGQKRQGSLVKFGSRRLGKNVFGMDDYGINPLLAVGDHFTVTYLADSPGTHLPIQVTPQWKHRKLMFMAAIIGAVYLFALGLLVVAFRNIPEGSPGFAVWLAESGPNKIMSATITIAPPRNYPVICLISLWLAAWAVAFFWIGSGFSGGVTVTVQTIAFIALVAGGVLLRAAWDGSEEIKADPTLLVVTDTHLFPKQSFSYHVARIQNMRIGESGGRGDMRLYFDYEGEKQTIGIRPLSADEADQIADVLARLMPVGAPSLEQMAPATPQLPWMGFKHILGATKKNVPTPAPGSDREITPRGLVGLSPLFVLAFITGYVVHRFSGGRTSPLWLVGPAWVVFAIMYGILWARMIAQRRRGGRLDPKPFRRELAVLRGVMLFMILWLFIGFILWYFVSLNRGDLAAPPQMAVNHALSHCSAVSTATDNAGNRYDLYTFLDWRVQKHGPDGKFRWAIAVRGWKGAVGKLAVDAKGNIYVLAGDVDVYDPDGALIRTVVGIPGLEKKWEITPAGVVIDHATTPPRRL
ncbi:MAG: hypothetical protein ABFD69_02925 [Candidatus Sumerlaeia bacterium]